VSEQQPSASEGAIQPIGFLVALAPDWRVSRVSANIGDHLGAPAADLIGQPVTSLFAQEAVHSLRNRLALLRTPDSAERLFSVALSGGDDLFDVALHMSGNHVVIEAEPSRDHRHDRDSTGTVRGMVSQLGAIDALPAFFNEAARHMRALTGFDRVVIQRRGADGSAERAGEAMRGSAPLTDMLSLADDPAESSPVVTIIADTAADPVAIIAPATARPVPLDLSHSMLRASSPGRLAALGDAGIGAAILLPLIVGGQRWGEIACTHRAACCPSFERRSAIEWYALMLALQIENRELKARLASV
jgi:light-regulated signal transduction histidine kinase (bacteriophytochrome)